MSVHIYNSLSKKKEELVPIKNRTVNMYSCGVTVYDKCHIGHARSLYIFDVIKRYLLFRGFDVKFVRNITDVDDKIINKAQETNRSFEEVVDENIRAYREDLKNFHLSEADTEPRATENIKEMVAHIEKLIADGYAYEKEGDVYFNVRKFSEYGKLSGQSIEHMQKAVRIDADEKKEDPLDFALWKKSKENEPFWDSPWGKGRPGWHIECSCMSMKYLKTPTLDIHAGGRDLIFPHHENEIAQSEALTGKPFAKYWIHHGLLTINGQKMAKSLGNFITIDDVLKKYSADQLKYFYLSSNYNSPIDYSDEKCIDAKKALAKFETLKHKVEQMDQVGDGKADEALIKKHKNAFIEAMDDDFNTPKALGVLFDFLSDINKLIDSKGEKNMIIDASNELFALIEEIFGISIKSSGTYEISIDNEIQNLLTARQQARENKDFQKADEIRDQLKDKGYSVEDSKDGQKIRKL